MIPRLPGEVVSKLILPFRCRLRNVYIGADLYAARERQKRIRGHTKNRIVKILEMERKLIQLRRANCVGVIDQKTVELVVVRIPAREIGVSWITDLVIGRIVLLVR